MGWDLVVWMAVWMAVLIFLTGGFALVGIMGTVLCRSLYLIVLDAVQIVRRR